MGAKAASDLSYAETSGDFRAFASDLQVVINGLQALGTPPVDDGSMGRGVGDWQAAVRDVSDGDPQAFANDYRLGLQEFAAVGLTSCNGGVAP